MQFNDGTAFNAEAVKLYFDNMKSVIGTSANYGQLDMLTTEITVDDEYTVSFHLSRPYYNVLNDLAMVMPAVFSPLLLSMKMALLIRSI